MKRRPCGELKEDDMKDTHYTAVKEFPYSTREGKIKIIKCGEILKRYSRGYRNSTHSLPCKVVENNPPYFIPIDMSAGELVIRDHRIYVYMGINDGIVMLSTLCRDKSLYIDISKDFQDFRTVTVSEISGYFYKGETIAFVTPSQKLIDGVTILRISEDNTQFTVFLEEEIQVFSWDEVRFLMKLQRQEVISAQSRNFLLSRIKEIQEFYSCVAGDDNDVTSWKDAYAQAFNSISSTITSMRVI